MALPLLSVLLFMEIPLTVVSCLMTIPLSKMYHYYLMLEGSCERIPLTLVVCAEDFSGN